MQFSPKIFGLNVEIFGLFSGSPKSDFRTILGLCVLFLCVIATKMKNMLVV